MECFTFIWKIENFSFCMTRHNQDLCSPSFKVGNTRWKLLLSPKAGLKGEILRLVLNNEETTDIQLQFDCELSFLGDDGTVLRNHKVVSAVIIKSLNWVCADYIERAAIFGSKKDLFLPQDTLTVRCRIWKAELQPQQCMVKTSFHRKSFLWNIERFSIIKKIANKSLQLAARDLHISLHKNLYTQNGSANIEITKTKGKAICFANCKICALNVNGKELANLHDYDSPPSNLKNPWRFPIILKKEDISNDTLSLQWEFTVADTEISHGKLQSFLDSPPTPTHVALQAKSNPYMSSNTSSSTLQKDLFGLYRDQKLCDATLKTDGASFHVHRSVLGARSPVFCAMFENETSERRSGIVDIPDIDQDTLNRMIQYFYTDTLEELHWKEVSKLYYAADKYAFDSLKGKCVAALKAKLTVSNACEIIVLAFTHQDEDLMQSVQEFICEHDEIICSEEWKCLEEDNPQLTIKLFRAIALNLKKGKQ